MFRISTQTLDGELVLKLEGCLTGACVHELETCWLGAVETLRDRQLRVDLTGLWRVDAAGRELLAEMHRAGAHFVATGCEMPEVVREISESACAAVSAHSRRTDSSLSAEARSANAGLSTEARSAGSDLSAEARSAKAERS
jgi:anti-anti-sigma regulatory factor